MRVDDELLRYTGIELSVSCRSLIQADDLYAYNLGDVDAIPHDCLHQRPVVLHYRRLAGMEAVRLGPAQAEADTQGADLGRSIRRPRVFGHIQTRNTNLACDASYLHQ